MTAVTQWIQSYGVETLVILVIIVALLVYTYKNKQGLLAKAALYAVTKAEEAWGSNMGKIKFSEVYTYLQKQYPIVTFFFTEKQITLIIEDALEKLKVILATKAAKEKTETSITEENSNVEA